MRQAKRIDAELAEAHKCEKADALEIARQLYKEFGFCCGDAERLAGER